MDTESLNLREIILNLREPHVIRDLKLPWNCFKISFTDWCRLLFESEENGIKKFESASNNFFNKPQWEKYRDHVSLNFMQFCKMNELINNDANSDVMDNDNDHLKEKWIGFNYKNIESVPNFCKSDISFKDFGFPNIDDDITFWLGSKDAHTPCHYDTYGCNIVVQIFGRKMWLLFPPETNLKSIRVPYEESSVYCSEVFYSPKNSNKYNEISQKCYKYILEPGEALIVPNKWWHYVENLTPALSVNCWIPLEKDLNSRLDECIVKYMVESILIESCSKKLIEEVMNPNEVFLGEETILKVLLNLVESKLNPTILQNKKTLKEYSYQYLTETEVEKLIQNTKEYKIEKIPNISENEFYEIIKLNSKRYNPKGSKEEYLHSCKDIKKVLINTICSPGVIKNIKERILKRITEINESDE